MRPTVLLGETSSREILAAMLPLGWGRLWTTKTPSVSYAEEPWGLDNGAFGAWLHGRPFPAVEFGRRVERAAAKMPTAPLIAVTPDIVMGGPRSLEFSLGWRDRLPDAWPWYLAVQNGMDAADVADALPLFAGLFLGGDTAFKRTAGQWCALAHAAGKRFHFARASVPRRLDHACRVGADSLDTAFPLWTYERLAEFMAHWTHGSCQLDFGGVPAATLAMAGPVGEWF